MAARLTRNGWILLAVAAAIAAGLTHGFGPAGPERETSAHPYALAVSWQPAFCETKPSRRECETQTRDRYDAANFTLHGLWPQPESNFYCDVPQEEVVRDKEGPWRELDTPRVAEPVWRRLREVMPGTRSNLHKHEWVKHGTCTGVGIDEYYARSIELLEDLNASAFRRTFVSSIGGMVNAGELRRAFSDAFGEGAGDALEILCEPDPDSGRVMITGLTIALGDPFSGNGTLGELISANASRPASDCREGVVDAVGLTP